MAFSPTRYAWLCARRIPASFLAHPWFTLRMCWRRVLFTLTRRFVGDSFRSPITGEFIFNVQSLINGFSIQVVRELDLPWVRYVRETPGCTVLDIGSNIGQFRAYVLALNPGAWVSTVDCWPEMERYVDADSHTSCALSYEKGEKTFTRSGVPGWTGSTAIGWTGEQTTVQTLSLDGLRAVPVAQFGVIKIDVDGAEIDVLLGGQETANAARFILVETENLVSVKALCPNRTWTTINGLDWCGELKP